jgi:hypothetical protein
MFPLVFPMTGVALLSVETSGAAVARLDKVLVSELGAAVSTGSNVLRACRRGGGRLDVLGSIWYHLNRDLRA